MSRLLSVARYLVLQWCSGREEVVHVLYDYFVEGKSPSALASKYGLSKHQVRGYAQRIMEKCSRLHVARILVDMLYPLVIELPRAYTELGDGDAVKCVLCGAVVPRNCFAAHLASRHRDFVEDLVHRIVEDLRRGLKSRGKLRG